MKTLFFIVFMLINAQFLYAQLQGQAKIDSLLKELPKMKNDTNGVNLLASLSYYFYSINTKKGIKYGVQGLKLAEKINWKLGKVKCYNSLGVNYSLGKSNKSKGLEYYKKGLNIAEELGHKEWMAYYLRGIGKIYSLQSDFSKTIEYYKKSLKLYLNLGAFKSTSDLYVSLGNTYHKIKDTINLHKTFNEAIKFLKSKNNKNELLIIYNNYGDRLHEFELNYKALDIYASGISLARKLKSKRLTTFLYNRSKVYDSLKDYPNSFKHVAEVLELFKKNGNLWGEAAAYSRIGDIYMLQSKDSNALIYYKKSISKFEEYKLTTFNSILLTVAEIYLNQKEFDSAQVYINYALKDSKNKKNKKFGYAYSYQTLATMNILKKEYSKALNNCDKSMKFWMQTNDTIGIADIYFLYSKIYFEYFNSNKKRNNEYLSKSLDYSEKSINLRKRIKYFYNYQEKLKLLKDLYLISKDTNKAFIILNENKNIDDSLYALEKSKNSIEQSKSIANLIAIRENEINQKEIEILKKEKENEKLQRYAMFGGIAGLGIIIGLVLIQRRKSEKLLLNVLPAKIAKRLKAKEHPIADHFDGASIIFIDLVGFTKMSSSTNPKEIVALLNDIFTLFDKLADKHGLEKIKTIGDAYMAVAGIPEIQADHSRRTAQMALDIKQEMKDFKTSDGTEIKFRIGIDCGAVVAGVIGEKKFIYDLWSDAVNTASRMESTGEAGRIQITDNFKTELEKFEGNWNFTLRGEFEIKGKGLMKTYFLGN